MGGILGFVPGATTHVGAMALAGSGSPSHLFGRFQTSVLLGLVHVVTGLVGIASARTSELARTFLLCAGVFYLLIWLVGMVQGGSWIPVDDADNWLHCVVGIVLLALGFFAASAAERQPVSASA